MMRTTLIGPALTVAFVPMVAAAQAQMKTDNWSGNIGISTVALPSYAGSNQYRVKAFPILSLEYKQRAYLGGAMGGTGAGAGVYVIRNPTFTWSTEISGAPERFERYGDGLAGMGRRGAATYAGSNVSFQLGAVTAGAGVQLGLGNDEGSTASLALSTKHNYGHRWMLGLSTGATFANSESMAYDFGVSPEQAARRQALIAAGDSRLDWRDAGSYDPGSGLKQAQASLSLGYLMREHVTALAFANVSRLGSEAADSPLARNRNAIVGGLGIAYGF
jgi:outer membrane scaffolding protein for murein synthesis (MipA/OmpV family)